MDLKKLTIAYHETGHAVMAMFRGEGVQLMSLKGMDSPNGTGRYLGFMTLEATEQKTKITVNDAIRKIMISLGGYASEILFFEVCTPGGNDLTTAGKWAESLLQVEEYKNLMSNLPLPEPGPLDEIQNLQIRAYIHHMIPECARVLAPLGPLIKFLAEELYKKEELNGDIVEAHFMTYMQTKMASSK